MSAYPRPIHCVECECNFQPEENGVFLLEMAVFGPYKIWHADLWKCPSCGKKIISEYGHTPIAFHHQENFQVMLDTVKDSGKFYVNRTRKGG